MLYLISKNIYLHSFTEMKSVLVYDFFFIQRYNNVSNPEWHNLSNNATFFAMHVCSNIPDFNVLRRFLIILMILILHIKCLLPHVSLDTMTIYLRIAIYSTEFFVCLLVCVFLRFLFVFFLVHGYFCLTGNMYHGGIYTVIRSGSRSLTAGWSTPVSPKGSIWKGYGRDCLNPEL
jgi:hypothetical protein